MFVPFLLIQINTFSKTATIKRNGTNCIGSTTKQPRRVGPPRSHLSLFICDFLINLHCKAQTVKINTKKLLVIQ